jgi:SAM-dependent methyltransferase
MLRKVAGETRDIVQREEGRVLFGQDPAAYEAGRPQYPEAVYEILEHRCGVSSGVRVLEIGPGTGLVTRRLLDVGATVLAVEPNPNLAARLTASFGDGLEVVESTFETAEIDEGTFDVAVAATSFHWVDQRVGLAKLGRSIRPGGSVALWWTLYQDPFSQDEVSRAIEGILGPRIEGAFEEPGRPPFQLDVEHRLRDLERWGHFRNLEAEIIRTPRVLDASQVRALFASVAFVLRRAPEEQTAVLDAIEDEIRDHFGGRVQRQFVTALYTGQRPGEQPRAK